MAGFVSGIQQVGVGVRNYAEAWEWYRRAFGMDVPVFNDSAEAAHMKSYTGDTVHSRTAVLAVNLKGGGGFEIWQFESRTPEDPGFSILPGDLGITSISLKTPEIGRLFDRHRSEGILLSNGIKSDPFGRQCYYVSDPYGNVFQVVESHEVFAGTSHPCGGVSGVTIGVRDIDAARPLFSEVLGYDIEVGRHEGTFDDYAGIDGGEQKLTRALFRQSRPGIGPFGALFGASTIELVTTHDRSPRKIFEGRYWGDCGFIHVCFDIRDTEALKQTSAAAGFPFTVDSGSAFDMGQAAGRFSYTEDPDGTLIEMVETFKMPIIQKIGFYLDLSKRHPEKPLPGWMLKALKLTRVR